jgi:hypothetical protein
MPTAVAITYRLRLPAPRCTHSRRGVVDDVVAIDRFHARTIPPFGWYPILAVGRSAAEGQKVTSRHNRRLAGGPDDANYQMATSSADEEVRNADGTGYVSTQHVVVAPSAPLERRMLGALDAGSTPVPRSPPDSAGVAASRHNLVSRSIAS